MKIKTAILMAAMIAMTAGLAHAQTGAPNTGTTLSQPPRNSDPAPMDQSKQKDVSPGSQNSSIKQEK